MLCDGLPMGSYLALQIQLGTCYNRLRTGLCLERLPWKHPGRSNRMALATIVNSLCRCLALRTGDIIATHGLNGFCFVTSVHSSGKTTVPFLQTECGDAPPNPILSRRHLIPSLLPTRSVVHFWQYPHGVDAMRKRRLLE